ncbi:hypothetical protein H072_9526 [Dactylellina haptotyla CBS 200.50]|uniref:Uncharacterized protein n=1 Tax=Dactylellina haptotyla (strain CBS 200.50) TaxID=1284197 RepID=S8A1R7_DACHA|nr:hypothetical protein H072_9526 [Dactylellina haptotyla CBS 200.50]
MSGALPVPLGSNISIDEFQAILSRYPDVLKLVSDKKQPKKPKDGDSKTLEEIDKWRDGLSELLVSKGTRTLDAGTVKEIVNWKLKRGKFRPTIMPLVLSNTTKELESIVNKALSMPSPEQVTSSGTHDDDDDDDDDDNDDNALANISAMIKILTKLKGIGPATATAILSAVFPDTIPMFSDEAFRWLMMDEKSSSSSAGWNRSIKYDAKEYADFFKKVRQLCKKLILENKDIVVDAGSVEKVGWVLGQEYILGIRFPLEEKSRKASTASKKEPTVGKQEKQDNASSGSSEVSKSKVSRKPETTKTSAKRKDISTAIEPPALRRSKRNKEGSGLD